MKSVLRTSSAIAVCIAILFALQVAVGAQQKEIRVAAAADLKFAMPEIAAQYEKETGTKVTVSFGSSGNFFAQLQNGAPFDIFFSADKDYPSKLNDAGLVESGTLNPYAIGRIVIWVPVNSSVDPASQQWKSLSDPSVQKIAIANPEHAPYGRAAVAAMQKARVYDELKPKLVYGENIAQAAQFVQSGNAQAGIISESLTYAPEMKTGKKWQVPQDLYPQISQWAAVMKNSTNKDGARAFFAYFQKQRATLEKYGFVLP